MSGGKRERKYGDSCGPRQVGMGFKERVIPGQQWRRRRENCVQARSPGAGRGGRAGVGRGGESAGGRSAVGGPWVGAQEAGGGSWARRSEFARATGSQEAGLVAD